jgi:DnaK suppressor protein
MPGKRAAAKKSSSRKGKKVANKPSAARRPSKASRKSKVKSAKKKTVKSTRKTSRKKVSKKKVRATRAHQQVSKKAKAAAPKRAATKKRARPAAPKPSSRRRSTASLLSGPVRGFQPYQLRRGEDYMSKGQLEHFRQILLAWKRELMEEVDRTMLHMKDDAANFPDPNDRATQESEFGLELRTRDRERKLLKKIDSALVRIDDGSYERQFRDREDQYR